MHSYILNMNKVLDFIANSNLHIFTDKYFISYRKFEIHLFLVLERKKTI